MNLEQQISSLELSKRLKELGMKQESLWAYNHKGFPFSRGESDMWTEQWLSAFTVAELGEMLPVYVTSGKKDNGAWYCATISHDMGWKEESFDAEIEADARAKMLIYLLENNLMTL